MSLRYAGTCVLCGTEILKDAEALYDRSAKAVRCIDCPSDAPADIDTGRAGGSARQEFERRKAAREERVKGRVGNFFGTVLFAVTDEPQSTQAWERGAIGEEKLAKALDAVPGLQVLHDRRVPGTRGNIDHIVIAPAGIFVVDAKHYKGKIEIRDKGGWFKTDERLYVGGRDRSHLAKEMAWQVEAVRHALAAAGSDFIDMPLEPVLCFIDGEWPLLFPPTKFGGVHIEGKRSIKKLVTKNATLDEAMIQRVARLLAAHLPAK